MIILKNLKWIILILGILLVLVLFRISDQHIFKADVKTAVAASVNNNNLITLTQLKQLATPFLIVDLGGNAGLDSLHLKPFVQIPFDKLLDPASRKVLNEANCELILKADDVSTASRAWVILNQSGYGKLRILTVGQDSEVLKYKFQPDTTARLEPDSL